MDSGPPCSWCGECRTAGCVNVCRSAMLVLRGKGLPGRGSSFVAPGTPGPVPGEGQGSSCLLDPVTSLSHEVSPSAAAPLLCPSATPVPHTSPPSPFSAGAIPSTRGPLHARSLTCVSTGEPQGPSLVRGGFSQQECFLCFQQLSSPFYPR